MISKWPASVIEDEWSRDTPIIFLGAADDDMSRLKGCGSSVVDYIVKRDVFGEAGWQETLRAGITVCLRSGNRRLALRFGLRSAKLV
jgi:DNA-binding response OmpR family regulator